MNGLFSDLQLQDIALLSLHFDIADVAPVGDTNITVTVDTSSTTFEDVGEGRLASTKMTVTAYVAEEGRSDSPQATFRATVAVLYLALQTISQSVDVDTELRHRSLYDGYGFVRDYAKRLARVSPMARFNLPSIDVAALS